VREKVKKAKAAKQGWQDLKQNTSVYVTGLPEDVSEVEIMEVFSKCGIIKEDEAVRAHARPVACFEQECNICLGV
jgi:hypothetical protein